MCQIGALHCSTGRSIAAECCTGMTPNPAT